MIKAESRQDVGKKIAKKLRKEGKVPAIIYGDKKDSIPITIDLDYVKQILKSEKKENTLLKIHRDDITVDAMLHEVQYDYLSDNIIHVDFLRVDVTKEVNVWVPIVVTGEPIGVKVEDGVFDFISREIKVRCTPERIPNNFELDVSELHSGSSIKVCDIELGENVKLMLEPQRVICAVNAKGAGPAEEEEEEEVLEEGAVEETDEKAAEAK